MKKHCFTFVTIAVLVLISPVVMADPANENTLNSSASLKVVNPIVLTQVANLNFGTMGVGWGGSVTLSPETNVRTAVDAVYLLPDDSEHVANYTISGSPQSAYIVTFEENFKVKNSDSDELTVVPSIYIASAGEMNVKEGTLNEEGADGFKIGGAVNFGAETKKGEYQGSFTVTVNYN